MNILLKSKSILLVAIRRAVFVGLLLVSMLPIAATSHLDEYTDLAPEASGLAAPYLDYIVFPGTTSPDGKYAFIYPNRAYTEDPSHSWHSYLVALHPFRVLLRLPDFARVGQSSNGDLEVNWASDSSAVVAVEDGKWGPDTVLAIPVQNGRVRRVTDLTAQIRQIVLGHLKNKKPEDRDVAAGFVFVGEDTSPDAWTINGKNQVVVSCACEAEPNLGRPLWRANLSGFWKIRDRQYVGLSYLEIPEPAHQSQ